MIKLIHGNLVETSYEVPEEAKNATIFGVGNGYYGIRGSFEEFGDVYLQGTYIRGLFDEIIEIPPAISRNEYMKRYYFDEQKLKEFEKEDSCINLCDFTSIKILVDGKALLPWKNKIVFWKRRFNYQDGSLIRDVIYEDEIGNQTKIHFCKTPCFHDNHLFLQSVVVEKLNHDLSVEIRSGIDVLVKTNGQFKSILTKYRQGDISEFEFSVGEKYQMTAKVAYRSVTQGAKFQSFGYQDGVYYASFSMESRFAALQKIVRISVNIDPDKDQGMRSLPDIRETYLATKKAFRKVWKKFDMKVCGNAEIDAYLRYANYQTLIGIDRFDQVHSFSAKNLTSEKYNQFVWWDAEIYQLPSYLHSFPEACKNALMYRVNRLEESRRLAEKEGYRGAKFAFCSSVNGDENVWIYARHPFYQIHVSADVCYGLLSYYKATKDDEFMLSHGLEVIHEVLRYFLSRSIKKEDGKYHLCNVTGTDEHHDYVDDDAYTNYLVHQILKEGLDIAHENNLHWDDGRELAHFMRHLYLPGPNERGIIPQFNGYFDLKPHLPLEGKANPGFQMRQSGLYHLSQVIKQPDVLMLYTYLDIDNLTGSYPRNAKFYIEKCENSSSLTYPVHAIAEIDNGHKRGFLTWLKENLTMDFKDIFGNAHEGLHASALAGGRVALIRGLCGLKDRLDSLTIDPKYCEALGNIKFQYTYQGNDIYFELKQHQLIVEPKFELAISHKGRRRLIKPQQKTVIHF